MADPVDRYMVNTALGALADGFGLRLDDDTLNELSHHVADVLDEKGTEYAPERSGSDA